MQPMTLHAPKTLKRRSLHAGRLDRFLGAEKIAHLSGLMRDGGGPGKRWYGEPIYCADLPGNVWIGPDGDFSGHLGGFGGYSNAYDAIAEHTRKIWREIGAQHRAPMAAAGFASISDALARASAGYRQYPSGNISKVGVSGSAGATNTLWAVGTAPAAGSAGSAAPGGDIPTSASTGAAAYVNPASGTMHLTGADLFASAINNTLLLYDRLFHVAKTMASTSTEAVTGVPTRYTSTTPGDQDYAGGNFLAIECQTVLAVTAHNWTACLYTDQDGNTGAALPAVTGVSSGCPVGRLDMPSNTWFAPLASGDTGIKALTQMQCSASVATGAINFVIGHALGFLAFPVASIVLPFDWLTNKDQAPRVFDDACLALMEPVKPSSTGCTYGGRIHLTNAA